MKPVKNMPTNPELWSRAKAAAKSKYDVYPSAYANGFAAKWYKERGGDWKKMQVMGNGGIPNNSGFVALPKYVQQKIINNMQAGGQKMPPELAYARFAAAGNLNQLGKYGYKNGGLAIPMYADGGEPDGEMALGQINATINKLSKLRNSIQPNSDLEPWVSSKLTMVDDYANSVSDYMMYNPETKKMLNPSLQEMRNGGIPMYGPGGQKQNPPKVYTDKKMFEQANQNYTDSLNLYNLSNRLARIAGYSFPSNYSFSTNPILYEDYTIPYNSTGTTTNINGDIIKVGKNEYRNEVEKSLKRKIKPFGWTYGDIAIPVYKKPVQPVVYQPTTSLEKLKIATRPLDNPKVTPRGELLPVPSKQTVNLTNLIQPGTHPIDIYDRRGNFLRTEFTGDSEGVPNHHYTGEHHYSPRGGNAFLDLNAPIKEIEKRAEGGSIPERYKNMGFSSVGTKKDSTRPGKKWMVLAKKGEDYKVVHGGYQGMQDFKQHHSEQRRENFWNRMGGRDSAKATDPFSPLYWHKKFGTWQNGGQLRQFEPGGTNGGVQDHYVNTEPLENKLKWGTTNPMTTDILNTFQKQSQQIANQSGDVPLALPVNIGPPEYQEPSSNARPYMEMDSNQNTQEAVTPESIQNVKKPNIKTKTVREPFNQKYMMASNALFTGLDMLGKRNKNSYSNAIKDFNKNQSEYENNNVDLYSTNQDYYGKYEEGGPTKNSLKPFYETMAQDPTYFADELEALKDDYDQEVAEQQLQKEEENYQTLSEYIDAVVSNNMPSERAGQYDMDMTYQPYQAPQRRQMYSKNNTSSESSYLPPLNIGFNASTNMYANSLPLEGMTYKMGAKGSNNKIDCSGGVCRILNLPIMTSEDITVKGKNFRPYQGEQDLQEGTVIGFDFGPKKHDVGRKYGIDHVGVIVKNPNTNQLEYKESVSGVGFRTLTIPQFLKKYPDRAKQIYVSNYGKN